MSSPRVIESPLGHRISAQRDDERLAAVARFICFFAFASLVWAPITTTRGYWWAGLVGAFCSGGIAFAMYEEWQSRRFTRAMARQFKTNSAQVKYSAWWEGVKRAAAAAGYRSIFFANDARTNALHEMFREYHRRGLCPSDALREWESDYETGTRKPETGKGMR